MHVVPVGPDLHERDLVPRRDLQADRAERRVDLCGEHGPAILRRTHEVVQQH
jgi:hypothetical protein